MSERYVALSRVGKGSYGIVIKARDALTGRRVAIKKVSLQQRTRLPLIRELEAMRNSSHENIISLLDSFCSRDTLSLVMPYVENTLKDIINDAKRPRQETCIRFFYRQVLLGLAYLHGIGIMHRDIKPENLLVTTKNQVKIADFGQATLYYPDEPDRKYCEQVATRWYRSPELLFSSPFHSPAVDVWAAGCVLAELANSAPLFPGRNDFEQISRVFSIMGTPTEESWPAWKQLPDSQKVVFEDCAERTDWQNIVPSASSRLLRFLRLHLQLDPEKRSSTAALLQHPFAVAAPPPDYRPPPTASQPVSLPQAALPFFRVDQ